MYTMHRDFSTIVERLQTLDSAQYCNSIRTETTNERMLENRINI